MHWNFKHGVSLGVVGGAALVIAASSFLSARRRRRDRVGHASRANAALEAIAKAKLANVLDGDVHWLPSSPSGVIRLWYKIHLGPGRHEYRIVALQEGSEARCEPLFDHGALAAELGKHGFPREQLDVAALPSTGVTVEHKAGTMAETSANKSSTGEGDVDCSGVQADPPLWVTFQAFGSSWRWGPVSSDDTEVKPRLEAIPRAQTALRPVWRAHFKTSKDGPQMRVKFENRMSAADMNISWLDREGNKVYYTLVPPGESREQFTYVGHVWLFTVKPDLIVPAADLQKDEDEENVATCSDSDGGSSTCTSSDDESGSSGSLSARSSSPSLSWIGKRRAEGWLGTYESDANHTTVCIDDDFLASVSAWAGDKNCDSAGIGNSSAKEGTRGWTSAHTEHLVTWMRPGYRGKRWCCDECRSERSGFSWHCVSCCFDLCSSCWSTSGEIKEDLPRLPLDAIPEKRRFDAVWNPDGNRVAWVHDHNVHLLDFSNQQQTDGDPCKISALDPMTLTTDGLKGDAYSSSLLSWSPDGHALAACKVRQVRKPRRLRFIESSPPGEVHSKMRDKVYVKPGDDLPASQFIILQPPGSDEWIAPAAPAPTAQERPEAPKFTTHTGYISGGGDLLEAIMTVEEAKSRCASLLGCLGFTFQGKMTDGPVKIYFKNKWDLSGSGWTSFKVVQPRTKKKRVGRTEAPPASAPASGWSRIDVAGSLFPDPFTEDGRLEAKWTRDSQELYVSYIARDRQCFRLVACDRRSGAERVVMEESADAGPYTADSDKGSFVDCTNGKRWWRWLNKGKDVLFLSERDGWNHLYRTVARPEKPEPQGVEQLTSGEWVVRQVMHVDEEKGFVWLVANGCVPGHDPYYKHLLKVSLAMREQGAAHRQELIVLTQDGDGDHQVEFSPNKQFFIDTWSRVDAPPVVQIRCAFTGALLAELARGDASALYRAGYRPPVRFATAGRDGKTDIHGVIYRPPNNSREWFSQLVFPARTPVVEEIYSGPHGAHCPKTWEEALRAHTARSVAAEGFCVVVLDGMGTNFRGRRFLDVGAWQSLDDQGFLDRKLWIRAAAARYPWMDISGGIGIYGGSAGGQAAMRALLDHGDLYRVAAACCGCHDNRLDKIWWNEQWMGPDTGGDWYVRSSNADQAHKLSDDQRLLLIVGELDDNVDPSSTLRVVGALQKAQKHNFELCVVVGQGHGAADTRYGERKRKEFLLRHLMC